ncbi:MAG TPA: copper resistance protein CopC [Actinomycetota bacterium]|nr:copper resistance protein CopC [Actinomycetota bacterium]
MNRYLGLGPAVLVAALTTLAIPTALAHGDLVRTIPKANSVRDEVPDHVLLEFSQRPRKGADIRVKDGCGDDVVRTVQLQGATAHVEIDPEAQPGHFRIAYGIVSAVDGDATQGKFAVHVRGRPECSSGPGGYEVPLQRPPLQDTAAPEPETTSNSQLLLLGTLGTVGLAGLGLVLRRGREVS